MRRAALVLAVLLFCSPLLSAADSPFAGWDAKKVASHKKTGKNRIAGKLRRWQTARKGLVFRCSSCQGSGRVRRVRGRRVFSGPCPTCKDTGGCISKDRFLLVFWELRSPHYRSAKERLTELESHYNRARANPREAIDFLEQITKWSRKSIDVKGNYAIVTYTEKHEKIEHEEKVVWIQVDGKWWLAHDEIDAEFARHEYPEPDADATRTEKPAKKPAPAKPGAKPAADPPKADPPAKQPPDKPPTAKPPTAKPPPAKPKKPPEDPETLFRVTAPTIRHVEENAYKVFGQITNLTKERRFAYLIVTVSFFKGDRLVDTTECNVGTVILKPGRTATYSGFLYADKAPAFDRKVVRVSKYEEME